MLIWSNSAEVNGLNSTPISIVSFKINSDLTGDILGIHQYQICPSVFKFCVQEVIPFRHATSPEDKELRGSAAANDQKSHFILESLHIKKNTRRNQRNCSLGSA